MGLGLGLDREPRWRLKQALSLKYKSVVVVYSAYLLLLLEHEAGEQLAFRLAMDGQKRQRQARRLAQVALVRGQVDLKRLAIGLLGLEVECTRLRLDLRAWLGLGLWLVLGLGLVLGQGLVLWLGLGLGLGLGAIALRKGARILRLRCRALG